MTPEEKKEKIKAQKREWYNRNKEAVAKQRKEKYDTDTKKAIVAPEVPLKIKSSALNQSKYYQETQNLKEYSYEEFVENLGFRPESQRFQPKSSIYRVKYNVNQQMPSQKDLNAVPLKEPLSDRIFKPLGLRKVVEGSGMSWAKDSHSFAHEYVWRNL